jgi:hypothetical protein
VYCQEGKLPSKIQIKMTELLFSNSYYFPHSDSFHVPWNVSNPYLSPVASPYANISQGYYFTSPQPVSPHSSYSPATSSTPSTPTYSSDSSEGEYSEDCLFHNRTNIRKAKISDVDSELIRQCLPTDGTADQKRKRLMEHLFPKHATVKRGKELVTV